MNRAFQYRIHLVERLRALLESSGTSVSAVEKRLDHGRGYVADALRGNKKLSVETILEVLDAIGISPEEFFERPLPALNERGGKRSPSERHPPATSRRRGRPRRSAVVRAVAVLLADDGLEPDDLRDVQRELAAAVRRRRAAK